MSSPRELLIPNLFRSFLPFRKFSAESHTTKWKKKQSKRDYSSLKTVTKSVQLIAKIFDAWFGNLPQRAEHTLQVFSIKKRLKWGRESLTDLCPEEV